MTPHTSNHKGAKLFLLSFITLLLCGVVTAQSDLFRVEVFEEGKDGYHSYRIPSIIVSPKGTLIAVCEGRKNGRGDAGDIDLVMKRSFDNGATWTPMTVIDDWEDNTTGNPTMVVDAKTGIVWMLITRNPGGSKEEDIVSGAVRLGRTIWVMKSEDDGATWSKPIEITSSVKKKGWTWYATGPGVGIQLKSGRLVIPCNHSEPNKTSISHIIYSDDHGATWKLGGNADAHTNESQVVELSNGSLMLNMRNAKSEPQYFTRAVAISKDGGLTWDKTTHDPMLIEPICQGSILKYPKNDKEKEKGGGDVILYSNPVSLRREKMTVRVSYDDGKTWPVTKLIDPKPSGYSILTVLPNKQIGLLYEHGEKDSREKIGFVRFSLGN